MALDCDNARIGASVFLRDGFHAAGMLDFVRVEIAGNLKVENATLDAGLDMEAARVGHGFFWQNVTGAREMLDLTEAHVGSLRDEWQSWAGCKTLILDGFRYDRLDGAMTVAQRLAWLGMARHKRRVVSNGAPAHHNGRDFDPQPHVQLAMILRAQGNRDGADRVLVDREARQRRAAWDRAHGRLDGTWRAARHSVQADLKRPIDWLFGLVAGYGHRPTRLLVVAGVLVIMAAVLAGRRMTRGSLRPTRRSS